MKKGIYLFVFAVLLISCGKKVGNLEHTIRYTTAKSAAKLSAVKSDSGYYSQFGTYITSLTPGHLSAKLNMLMYLDNWDQSDPSTHMLSYVDGHDNDPNYEIATYANFSNNQEVNITPILYSTDKRDDVFEIPEVTFNYFFLVPFYFYQEVELPVQYKDIDWQQIQYDSVSDKVMLKANNHFFEYKIFENLGGKIPFGYVFGGTDSTFLYNKEGLSVPASKDNPWGTQNTNPIIRSNKFTPITVEMPLKKEETIEMYSTVSFNSQDLIQLYAGKDNIPYTTDDVFVYAPNYWERIKVNVDVRHK